METQAALHTPSYCRIEVRGRLDSRSAGRFSSLSVSDNDGETVFAGIIESQLDLYVTSSSWPPPTFPGPR
jgi:hypothetical protein